MLVVLVLLALLVHVHGECANGCNGHGRCTSYDMCLCNRNWQANDCSERVCMYGLAHVDTPKGDLDMSGALTGPDHPVVDNSFNYPYGTTEQFPQMEDTDLNVLTNSAHYYMECSNKGTCDRSAGECVCFDGYDGVACQRASCPSGKDGVCSGHGVCMSARQLAIDDNKNQYRLWDRDTTMGCKCDAGYYGPSCAQKQCKYGVDPLYLDDSATVKYSTYDFATLTTAPTTADTETLRSYHTDEGVLLNDGTSTGGRGYWAIRFFDASGEDWVTTPIKAGASCGQVQSVLENLPNNVIPGGSTYCTRSWNVGRQDDEWSTTGGLGSSPTGTTLYDSSHPSTSAHPYKINYRMAIWDAYASSNSYEDVGEGGMYTPLTNLAPSFSSKKVVTSLVLAATTSQNYFQASHAKFEVGMLLRKIVSTTGVMSNLGVVKQVNVAASTSETYMVTFTAAAASLGLSDVVVGQFPSLSGTALSAPTATTVTTTTPGFKAGMYISITSFIAGDRTNGAIVLTSVTNTIVNGVTEYTLTYATGTVTAGSVGDKIAGYDATYSLSGLSANNVGTSGTSLLVRGDLGWSKNMIVSMSGATATVSDADITASSTTTNSAAFVAGDTQVTFTAAPLVGQVVSGPGIRSGQFVTAVAGNVATLSNPVDGPGASGGSYTFAPITTLTVSVFVPALAATGSSNLQLTGVSAMVDLTGVAGNPTGVGSAGGNSAVIITSGTLAKAPASPVVYQSDYCGPIKAPALISIDTTTQRVLTAATSNGAVGTAGVSSSGTTTLEIASVTNGAFVTGMTVTGFGIPEGTTITCGVNGRNAVVQTYTGTAVTYFPKGAGSCTLSKPLTAAIPAGAVIVGTMPVVQFTATTTTTSSTITISNVVGAPVVSGLYIQRADGTALPNDGAFLWCSVPIQVGSSGTCTMYQLTGTPSAPATYTPASGAITSQTLIATTLATAAATTIAKAISCLVVFSGDSPGASLPLVATKAIYVYPIFNGYGFGGPALGTAIVPAAATTLSNIVKTTSAGIAPGMTLGCTKVTLSTNNGDYSACFPSRSVTGVYFDGTHYQITFTGPAVSWATANGLFASYEAAGVNSNARASLTGYVYRIKFYGNPGKLRQPEIVTHLDGKRNSLMSVNYANQAPGTSKDYRVITKVWTDGQQGEENDYFADHCDGVQVTIGNKWVSTIDGVVSVTTDGGADQNKNTQAKFFLNSLTAAEKALLKKCLGNSDFDTTNNRDVYNWDWGYDEGLGYDHPIRFPHLVKLVRSVTTYTDGGYYAAIYFSESDNLDALGSGGTFYLLNPFSPPDAMSTDSYEVYTTKGVLALTSSSVAATFGFGSKTVYTVDPREDPNRNYADSQSTTVTPDKATTATLTTGSKTITVASATGIDNDMAVFGPGIRPNTLVTDISGTTVTLSLPVQTASGASVSVYFTSAGNGDLSCDIGLSDINKYSFVNNIDVKSLTTVAQERACLNKSDIITFLNPDYPAMNPPHMNLYTVTRLQKSAPMWSNTARWGGLASSSTYQDSNYQMGRPMTYMTNTISLDISTNWGASVGSALPGKFGYPQQSNSAPAEASSFRVYKFYPAQASTYNYVAPCSNRGMCNSDTGVCECFPGYTSDNCHEQSSLAL